MHFLQKSFIWSRQKTSQKKIWGWKTEKEREKAGWKN